MQWFLEFLGFKEPIKGPKLYQTINRKCLYFMVALFLFSVSLVIVCEVFDLYSKTTIGWIVNAVANGVFALLLLILIYALYLKVCWRRVQAAAKAAGYLHCPTCGHDLRGGLLKGSGLPVSIATDAAESDVVICPECGDTHNVRSLAMTWESPGQP